MMSSRNLAGTRHAGKTLRFYYKADCELCAAVQALSRRRHRVRRQAEFDNSQRVVTHEVVNDVINGMPMNDHEESMALAIEELLGYSATVDRTDQQQPGNNDQSPGGAADGPNDSQGVTTDSALRLAIPWWWVLLLIIIGVLLVILLIIILIIILWRCCKKRRRRTRRVADTHGHLTETSSLRQEKQPHQSQPQQQVHTASPATSDVTGPSAAVLAPVTVHRQEEVTSSLPRDVDDVRRDAELKVQPQVMVLSRTARDGDALRRLQEQLPDRWEGSRNVRPGNKYKSPGEVGGSPAKRAINPTT